MVPDTHTLPSVHADQNTLLVVERNARVARKLRPLLQISGYRIVAVDGTAPLSDVIRAEQPALIVLVVGKSDAPRELCQEITTSSPASFLPILAITDRETAIHQAGFIACGVAEVLAHPLDSDLLLTRIHALLHIRARFDALHNDSARLVASLLDRSQQLEAALASLKEIDLVKTALVGTVSHELRTPTLQVKSAIALLREAPAPGPSNETLFEMATLAIGRLEAIVMNISQVAESQSVKLEPVALGESVSLAIRNLERLWKAHDTDRIVRQNEQDYPLVTGDKRGVAQVLQHLLDNALKFSDGQGPVEILVESHADQVEITVRDYGIGIAANKLENIFVAFYQVDPSSTRKYGGAGVGLTLAQMIARKMDSEIRVRSTLGTGSTFSFSLPAARL